MLLGSWRFLKSLSKRCKWSINTEFYLMWKTCVTTTVACQLKPWLQVIFMAGDISTWPGKLPHSYSQKSCETISWMTCYFDRYINAQIDNTSLNMNIIVWPGLQNWDKWTVKDGIYLPIGLTGHIFEDEYE